MFSATPIPRYHESATSIITYDSSRVFDSQVGGHNPVFLQREVHQSQIFVNVNPPTQQCNIYHGDHCKYVGNLSPEFKGNIFRLINIKIGTSAQPKEEAPSTVNSGGLRRSTVSH
jgi:hypothetical protein